MKTKLTLICVLSLFLNKLGAQCFSLSDNVGGQICLGQSAQLIATQNNNCTGTLTYSWYPWAHVGNNFVITPTVTTQYTVIASNNTQLVGVLVVNPLPMVVATANPPIISSAPPGNVSNITLTGASNFYDLNNNTSVSNNFNVSPGVTTNYAFAGVDANGCANTANALVTVQNNVVPCVGCGASVPSIMAGGIITGPNCVNNNVTINGPVTINNADLIISSGQMITISSSGFLTITNSHLYACNDMWQGIEIQNGGRLTISNCLIEDAIEAIDVTNNTNQAMFLIVSNTTFNKNNVAIDIDNYVEQIPIYPFDIQNCLFTSRDIPFSSLSFPPTSAIAATALNPEAPLSNAFIDNNVYSQTVANANLKSPYSGLKPEAGIRLTNVGVTLNPNSNSTVYFELELGGVASQNIFDNMSAGMLAHNSNLSVYNSVFQNCMGQNYYVGIRCVADPTSHNRLRVESPPGTQNRFVDCGIGVYVNNYYSVSITNADFRSSKGCSGWNTLNWLPYSNGIDLTTNRYRDYRIEDNTLYNVNQGIGIMTTGTQLSLPGLNNPWGFGTYAGSLFVNRNIIADNLPGNPTTYQRLSTGINMGMWANQVSLFIADPLTQIVQVDKNDISNAEVGINFSLFKWLNFSCNSNIISLIAPLSGPPSFGIAHLAVNGTPTQPAKIANNVVVGYGTSVPLNFGIAFDLVQYMDVTCNYVSNVRNGYGFHYLNSNIQFNNNEMNANLHGLLLDWNGEIGTQGLTTLPQDNKWIGLWPSGTYKTALFNGSDAANSKLYIRSSLTGPYNPNGSSISTTIPTNNTDYSLTNGNLLVSTSAPGIAFCPITPSTARMAQNGFLNLPQLSSMANRKPFQDPSIEFNRRKLFYELANLQGYKATNNDSVSDFFKATEASNIGIFSKIDEALFTNNL
ncbi:MAG: hypothetical protein IT236_08085, partial [Bacteroidia bacterium]|nr:hypothetical protein [Bacteroidia bacterium]